MAESVGGDPVAVALFSKLWRSAHGRLPPRARVAARFGVLMLDLTGADFSAGEATIEASAFCGKMVISVPENARVVDSGAAIFSKRVVPHGDPGGKGGPVIRVRGRSIFSKVTVIRRGESSRRIEGPWQQWQWRW